MMIVDSCKKFTLEDILRDFPDKEKAKLFLKKNFNLGIALAFIKATYAKSDDPRERYEILTYGDMENKTHFSPIACVHIDSYKKDNGVWRIQILKTLAITPPENGQLLRLTNTRFFLEEICRVSCGEYGKNASISTGGITYTFELDPKEVKGEE